MLIINVYFIDQRIMNVAEESFKDFAAKSDEEFDRKRTYVNAKLKMNRVSIDQKIYFSITF